MTALFSISRSPFRSIAANWVWPLAGQSVRIPPEVGVFRGCQARPAASSALARRSTGLLLLFRSAAGCHLSLVPTCAWRGAAASWPLQCCGWQLGRRGQAAFVASLGTLRGLGPAHCAWQHIALALVQRKLPGLRVGVIQPHISLHVTSTDPANGCWLTLSLESPCLQTLLRGSSTDTRWWPVIPAGRRGPGHSQLLACTCALQARCAAPSQRLGARKAFSQRPPRRSSGP